MNLKDCTFFCRQNLVQGPYSVVRQIFLPSCMFVTLRPDLFVLAISL